MRLQSLTGVNEENSEPQDQKSAFCCFNSGNIEKLCDRYRTKAAGIIQELVKIVCRINRQQRDCWNADPPANGSVYDERDFVLARVITAEQVKLFMGRPSA
jgi:hypothetical protein